MGQGSEVSRESGIGKRRLRPVEARWEMFAICLHAVRPRVALQRDVPARMVSIKASAERRERAGPPL